MLFTSMRFDLSERIFHFKNDNLILPFFQPWVAEGDHLVFGVVQLQITPQDHMVLGAVVMEAVAPDLLLFGQDIAVARHDVERIGLVVGTAVGIEVVAVLVPDVGILEEKSVVGGHVVDHRVALEFVFVVTHLDAVYANARLRENGCGQVGRAVLDSHANLAAYAAPGSVDAAVFNLVLYIFTTLYFKYKISIRRHRPHFLIYDHFQFIHRLT